MILRVLSSLLLVVFCCGGAFAQDELVIKHIRPESETDPRNEYFLDLLRLALEKTKETDGVFKLETTELRMYQGRAIANLERDKSVDVVWTMTSREREEKLLPIRIPLLKGLLGHRIFLIKKGDQARFSAVETLDDLKTFRAGQGHDWPDFEILQANGLDVFKVANYEGLFKMLERGRIDYFPRGVNEIWAEVRAHADMDLEVEDTLMLQYTAPIYFFVNKKNAQLANRLEQGLRLAIQDGAFNDLLYNHPMIREMFERGNLESRKVFRLYNPLLPPETPVEEEELWYDSRQP